MTKGGTGVKSYTILQSTRVGEKILTRRLTGNLTSLVDCSTFAIMRPHSFLWDVLGGGSRGSRMFIEILSQGFIENNIEGDLSIYSKVSASF